jgi:hypothetical protein
MIEAGHALGKSPSAFTSVLSTGVIDQNPSKLAFGNSSRPGHCHMPIRLLR